VFIKVQGYLLREEHKLRLFEERVLVLSRVFGSKRDTVTEG
jgi:hypothetical protein